MLGWEEGSGERDPSRERGAPTRFGKEAAGSSEGAAGSGPRRRLATGGGKKQRPPIFGGWGKRKEAEDAPHAGAPSPAADRGARRPRGP